MSPIVRDATCAAAIVINLEIIYSVVGVQRRFVRWLLAPALCVPLALVVYFITNKDKRDRTPVGICKIRLACLNGK
jgi:hypothetical protein